jgi:hypothetical protein
MNEKGIVVCDDVCWCCGHKFDNEDKVKTSHHTLPKHLNSVKNVQIPICQMCHDKLTSTDTSALISFSFLLQKNARELISRTDKLIGHLKKG